MRSNIVEKMFGLLVISAIVASVSCDNTTVSYYVNLITKHLDAARRFQLPEDAREFQPKKPELHYYGSYDFIVVGAGTAGAVIANRLSEERDWNILVLEAGGFENDFTDILYYNNPLQFTEYNWGYLTVPQKDACLGMIDQRCPYPRGKGVGGTSIIHGAIYCRGNPNDFDRWAAEGNPGWSYEDVLPYFKKSEKVLIPHVDNSPHGYHGNDGPWPTELHHTHSPQLVAYYDANKELGYKIVDYTGKGQIGASPTQSNSHKGIRWSTGKAFLDPVLARPNVDLLTGSYVTKLLIDEKKQVFGVEFTHDNQQYLVDVKYEVILSAGVVGSPQILQLSGVGPKEFLEPLGIPVIHELPVGKNFKEHATFYGLVFETNYTEPVKPLSVYVEEFLNDFGPLTVGANIQGVGFYESQIARLRHVPDLELQFVPANSTSDFMPRVLNLKNTTAAALAVDPTKTFSVFLAALQEYSKGTIRIKSADPFEFPDIDPAILSDPEDKDIDTLYEGIKLVFEMIETKAFKHLDTKYAVKPLPACAKHNFLSKDYWYCALRQLTAHDYHGRGTCKMGPDPEHGAVVDNVLKVHGIGNLRVADNSVIPVDPAGNTAAVAVLIGEIAADLIKEEFLSQAPAKEYDDVDYDNYLQT